MNELEPELKAARSAGALRRTSNGNYCKVPSQLQRGVEFLRRGVASAPERPNSPSMISVDFTRALCSNTTQHTRAVSRTQKASV